MAAGGKQTLGKVRSESDAAFYVFLQFPSDVGRLNRVSFCLGKPFPDHLTLNETKLLFVFSRSGEPKWFLFAKMKRSFFLVSSKSAEKPDEPPQRTPFDVRSNRTVRSSWNTIGGLHHPNCEVRGWQHHAVGGVLLQEGPANISRHQLGR